MNHVPTQIQMAGTYAAKYGRSIQNVLLAATSCALHMEIVEGDSELFLLAHTFIFTQERKKNVWKNKKTNVNFPNDI